jgi:hypothetical protein
MFHLSKLRDTLFYTKQVRTYHQFSQNRKGVFKLFTVSVYSLFNVHISVWLSITWTWTKVAATERIVIFIMEGKGRGTMNITEHK